MDWKDPLKVVANLLMDTFTGWGMPQPAANVLIGFLGVLMLISILMVLDIALVWVERKVVARFQDRVGPNRVGPFGLIQPFADIIKLLIKEDTTPGGADKVVYNLAPILSMMSVLILWAVVPIAPTILGVDLNIGVLYIIAAGSIGTLSIIMAGWSSNNKFAMIGAFRQVAVMISFEIPMLATMLIPTIFAGSMGTAAITQAQYPIPYFLLSPLAALIFLIAAIAELGRAPFDMAEGESELVSGYNIEYSGMKFGMFYAGELLHAFTFGGFWAIMFFGGYGLFGLEYLPVWDRYPIIQNILNSPFTHILTLIVKAFLGYWLIMWIRYTLLRIRIDHMLAFNWKFLTPLAFALIIVTAFMNALLADAPTWLYISGMFFSNVFIAWGALEIARNYSRKERERIEGKSQVAEVGHS